MRESNGKVITFCEWEGGQDDESLISTRVEVAVKHVENQILHGQVQRANRQSGASVVKRVTIARNEYTTDLVTVKNTGE